MRTALASQLAIEAINDKNVFLMLIIKLVKDVKKLKLYFGKIDFVSYNKLAKTRKTAIVRKDQNLLKYDGTPNSPNNRTSIIDRFILM